MSVQERDVMEFDVLVVGAGPAGLAAACRLMQLAQEQQQQLSICVVEKAPEVGAHILSGAILDPRALNELFPDWQERDAPVSTEVRDDHIWWLKDAEHSRMVPDWLVPPSMHNLHRSTPQYIISAGQLCRWLGEQAEALGVDIFPGFAAQHLIIEEGAVRGVLTGDMGLEADGSAGSNHAPAMELRAQQTLFCEGSRGHLGKQLIDTFDLAKGRDPQHYAIGLKEQWEIPAEQHEPGKVVHGSGWPLDKDAHGGFFLYHAANRRVIAGLIVDLDYANPWLSPFDEFQRLKHHPLFADTLKGGSRLAYGARAITKGGINSLPKMTFPGGMLLGCDAGTLDFARIKGIHMAMKSGLVAAETLAPALADQQAAGAELDTFSRHWLDSWAGRELLAHANFGPAMHKYGSFLGGARNWLDQRLGGRLPRLHDRRHDYSTLKQIDQVERIHYPKPDGALSFDKASSVFLSSTNHRDTQPCHLQLVDVTGPVNDNIKRFAEPAQRYCPAGVYEVVERNGTEVLQINFQNCLHCKTCDIKDPAQNITWTPPEGGEGPIYADM